MDVTENKANKDLVEKRHISTPAGNGTRLPRSDIQTLNFMN